MKGANTEAEANEGGWRRSPWRRLRLVHLFVGIAGVAIVVAIGRIGSSEYLSIAYALSVVEISFATFYFTRRALYGSFVALVMIVLPCLLVPLTNVQSPGYSPAVHCRNNLRQLTMALRMYERDYGTLPPVVIRDKDGRPMHSWRVLMLPYLEEPNLYKQYRFDEPWDSPHNARIAQRMPRVFSCPACRLPGMTPYLAVRGSGTLMGSGEPVDVADFGVSPKRLAKQFLLIEYPRSNVRWTEPRDMPADYVCDGRIGGEFGLDHSQRAFRSDGSHVACYDTQVEVQGPFIAPDDVAFRERLTLPVRSSP